MASQPLDFVQLTYNLIDREVEQRLLPLARSAASRHRQPAVPAGRCSTGWAPAIAAWRPKSTAAVGPSSPSSSSFLTRPSPARFRRPQCRARAGEHGAASGRLPDQAMRARMAALVSRSDVGMVDLRPARSADVSSQTYYRLFGLTTVNGAVADCRACARARCLH